MRCVVALLLICGFVFGGIANGQEAAPAAEAPEAPVQEECADGPSTFELYLRATFLKLDVDTSLVRRVTGEKLELADELGMDSETVPEIRMRWRFAEHHSLTASYFGLDQSGNDIFILPLIVDDNLSGMWGRLESDLSLDYGRLGWRWEVAGRETDRFSVETILDAAIFNVDASYKRFDLLNPIFPTDEDDADGTAGIPLVGVRVEGMPTDYLNLYAEAAGMSAGKYGNIIDGELGVQILLGKYFTLEAGYRLLSIHGEYDSDDDKDFGDFLSGNWRLRRVILNQILWNNDDDEADIDLSGPFISGAIRF